MLAALLEHWRAVAVAILLLALVALFGTLKVERDHARSQLAAERARWGQEEAQRRLEVSQAQDRVRQAEINAAAVSQQAEGRYAKLQADSRRAATDLGSRLGLCLAQARLGAPGNSVPSHSTAAGGSTTATGEPSSGGSIAEAARAYALSCSTDAARLDALQLWVRGQFSAPSP